MKIVVQKGTLLWTTILLLQYSTYFTKKQAFSTKIFNTPYGFTLFLHLTHKNTHIQRSVLHWKLPSLQLLWLYRMPLFSTNFIKTKRERKEEAMNIREFLVKRKSRSREKFLKRRDKIGKFVDKLGVSNKTLTQKHEPNSSVK